jgi:hypothetical protein
VLFEKLADVVAPRIVDLNHESAHARLLAKGDSPSRKHETVGRGSNADDQERRRDRGGHAQRRGVPIEVIRPGDRVFLEPGEEHWHGAAPPIDD